MSATPASPENTLLDEAMDTLRKYALLNAVRHQGKAMPEPVLGRILSERPDLKPYVKELTQRIGLVVGEVNAMPFNEQRRVLEERWPELLEARAKPAVKGLPPLPNAERYTCVTTRYAPNPDFVLHFGQSRAIYLSYDYARMYKGRFVLRFEDTDPRLKKPCLEYYTAIREDLLWLGCKWDAEYIQSQRLSIYYEHAVQLMKAGNAYVCTCKPDVFKSKVLAHEPCLCRGLPVEEQLTRWEGMLAGGYREGAAALRVKTDLNHPNPAIRDWVALRIIDTRRSPHPLVGDRYRVWPTYNFAAGIDDHLMGVTHIIRGREFLPSVDRQMFLYKHLGWEYPDAIHYGKWKIQGGGVMSKSKLLKGLKEGLFKALDDPRLTTLAALRRRGILPETIHKMILEVGVKPVEAALSWENLYAYNKQIVDARANRYFFVAEPVTLTVKNLTKPYQAHLALHPSHPERGTRAMTVKPVNGEASILIAKKDAETFKEGQVVRLMDLFNVEIEKINGENCLEARFHSEPYPEAKRIGAQLIHWLPAGTGMPTEVVMPDASYKRGLCEDVCRQLKPGDLVQFERFGFVRVDAVEAAITAYYTHP